MYEVKMNYKELKKKLYANMELLVQKVDQWEANITEIITYQNYITKLLSNYKLLKWKKAKS